MWEYDGDTRDYCLLAPKYWSKVWYHEVRCWKWVIYTHDKGYHEAGGRMATKETAMEAVEVLLEIMA